MAFCLAEAFLEVGEVVGGALFSHVVGYWPEEWPVVDFEALFSVEIHLFVDVDLSEG